MFWTFLMTLLKVMRISSVNSDAAHLDHQQIVPGTSWSRRGLSIVQFCLSDFSAWFDIPTSAGQISDWVSLFASKPFLFSHFLLILQSVLECCQCWHRQLWVLTQTTSQKVAKKLTNCIKFILLLVFSISKGLKVFFAEKWKLFELSFMLWFSEEDRDSEVEASDYLIGDLDLVIIEIWW